MKEMDLFNTKGDMDKSDRRKKLGEISDELHLNLKEPTLGEMSDSVLETTNHTPKIKEVLENNASIVNIVDKKIIHQNKQINKNNGEASNQQFPDFDLSKNPEGFRPDSRTVPQEFVIPTEETTLHFLGNAKETDPYILTFTKGAYTYVVNIEDSESRELCAKELSKNTQRSFSWFKEKTGKENWVLYDTNQYELDHGVVNHHLHFNDLYRGVLELPVNVSSCYKMFSECDISSVSFTHAFDTANVVTMFEMFEHAIYRRPHVLYLTFNTENVEDMSYMFFRAKFLGGLKLAGNFTTKKVKTMRRMFSGMLLNENVEFSHCIDTSSLVDINGIFSECVIKTGFSLPEDFDTENIEDFSYCFYGTVFPDYFKLNKTFSTVSGKNFSYMFGKSIMPKFSNIISGFNTQNGEDFSCMFYCAKLPECFKLPETFKTSKAINMCRMFYKCKFTEEFFIPECFTTVNVKNICNMFANCQLSNTFALPESFSVEHIQEKRFVFSNSKGFLIDPDIVGLERVVRKFHKKYIKLYK